MTTLDSSIKARIFDAVLERDGNECAVCENHVQEPIMLRLLPRKSFKRFVENDQAYVLTCTRCHNRFQSGPFTGKSVQKSYKNNENLGFKIVIRQYELLHTKCQAKEEHAGVKKLLDNVKNVKPVKNTKTQVQRRNHFRTIQERDGEGCFWCKEHLEFKMANATFDHIITKSRGAGMRADNLVICCSKCNNARGDICSYEWADNYPVERSQELLRILKSLWGSQNELVAIHSQIEYVALSCKLAERQARTG